MARKAKSKNRTEDLLIDAAMGLAADTGWRGLSMAAIAAEANVALPKALHTYADKSHILAGFGARIDALVLEGTPAKLDDGESPRDRLFDVLMRRFDALQRYKPGLRHIIHQLPGEVPADPLAVACQLGQVMKSMRLALEIAGISAAGLVGGLKAKALAAIYANALRVWLDDDTPDLAQTMATLDRGLMRAEKLATALSAAIDKRAPATDQ